MSFRTNEKNQWVQASSGPKTGHEVAGIGSIQASRSTSQAPSTVSFAEGAQQREIIDAAALQAAAVTFADGLHGEDDLRIAATFSRIRS